MSEVMTVLFPGVRLVEAEHVIGVEFTNAFELLLPEMSGRGVFLGISRINHSCVANMAHANVLMGMSGIEF